jgi:hypothetical protein
MRNVSLVSRDGRGILMDLNAGLYYGLDEVAIRIWSLVCEGRTPTEIYSAIECEYDAPASRLRSDATAFLQSLLQFRLVHQ